MWRSGHAIPKPFTVTTALWPSSLFRGLPCGILSYIPAVDLWAAQRTCQIKKIVTGTVHFRTVHLVSVRPGRDSQEVRGRDKSLLPVPNDTMDYMAHIRTVGLHGMGRH